MKIKPNRQQRHKANNRFTFQKFSEKVRGLRVSARKFLLKRERTSEEDVTFFHQTLEKQRELNLTEAFQAFQDDLGRDIVTTAQLIHHADHIGDCLLKHLKVNNSPALTTLLDLVIAFSNDDPKGFYESHFYNFFTVLKSQLRVDSPEKIEAIFLCIVSLFVVLQKYIRDDLRKLYIEHNYADLLSVRYKGHVIELAAQSFAFLIRKHPRKEEFFTMAVKNMEKEQYNGLGKLFSAIMKSDVVQRLHSCTPEVLEILLNLVNADDVPQALTLQAVCCCMGNVAAYIGNSLPYKITDQEVSWKMDSKLVWPTLWNHLQSLLIKSKTSDNSDHIHAILKVILQLVTPKRGLLVLDLNEALQHCVAVIEASLPDTVGKIICEMLEVLLFSLHHEVSHTRLQQTIESVFLSNYSHSLKLAFIKKLLTFDRFDSVILPLLLDYSNRILSTSTDPMFQKSVISSLAGILLGKQMPCPTGNDLKSWNKYPMDFTMILSKADTPVENSIPSYIEQKIAQGIQDDDISNLEELLLVLICLPHISPLNCKKLKQNFKKILKKSVSMLNDEGTKIYTDKKQKEDDENLIDLNLKCNISLASRQLLYLLSSLIEAVAHILERKEFLSCMQTCSLLDVLMEKPVYRENVYLLRAIDIHLTIASEEQTEVLLNEENLKRIYPVLAPTLASTDPMVRLLTTRIFSLFPVALPPPSENMETHESMFQIMLQAEKLGVSPHSCRDRLRLLNMISGDQLKFRKPIDSFYDQAPLLYFIGHLCINYKDLWDPCSAAISDFANSLPTESFWPIWFTELRIVTLYCQNRKAAESDTKLCINNDIIMQLARSLKTHKGYKKLVAQPDYQNCRELMWKNMGLFTHLCEAHHKDIIPLFVTFMQTEAGYEFVSKNDSDENDEDVQKQKNDQEKKTSSSSSSNIESFKTSAGRKLPLTLLGMHLSVISKFANPKKLMHSDKLEALYKELLSYVAPSVQRLALDCIMSYKHPYLTPYRKYLFGIIDHKSYKKNLLQFSIDGPDKVVAEEHRTDLMPYLMRILYGKMNSKSGLGPKDTIAGRKALILRYLAGARESELQTFLGLAFGRVMPHLTGSILAIVRKCKNNEIKKFTLKNLQGCLNTLDSIITKIGNIVRGLMPSLLKILLLIMTQVTVRLQGRAELKKDDLVLAKQLRRESHKRLTSYFEHYETYNWSPEEVDAVFEAAVWPNLNDLPNDCVQATPTALLRLFSCWTENPRYFPLLAKCHHEDPTLTPLPFIIELLNHPKCSKNVQEYILSMVENLVTLEDYEESEEVYEGGKPEPIVCSSSVPVIKLESHDGQQQMNYGTALLVPHIHKLLKIVKGTLNKLDSGLDVDQRDFMILTNLAMWVTNEENSSALVSVIIPLIVKRKVKNPEQIPELLTVCTHLLPQVRHSTQYVQPILSQFGVIDTIEGREALCNILTVIASTNPEVKRVGEAAVNLNSVNPNLIDEVDYDKIFATYDQFKDYCATTEAVDVWHCQFFLYNGIYFIRKGEDASLRDMAILSLNQMLDMLVRLYPNHTTDFKIIVKQTFLKEIKLGLRSDDDNVRIEIVSLLRQIILKCHRYLPDMECLVTLTNSTDTDQDFFCNLTNIQLQRRTKAISKLSEGVRNGSITITHNVIQDFFLPVVSCYLFDRKYYKSHDLLIASIECIGCFAQVLPWKPYQKLLKLYLMKLQTTDMKFLKDAVNVLEAVLNGFHEKVERPVGQDEDCMKTNIDTEDLKVDDDNNEDEDEKEAVKGNRTTSIYHTLASGYIPHLQKLLQATSKTDKEHKVNKKRSADDDDIKRIPLALALVKLLNKLPVELLNANINSVLLKVITFLKSKDDNVRLQARNTIIKIMLEVGGSYLSWLVKDLRSVLQWGFQSHVLSFTLYSVLCELKSTLEAQHVNACLKEMLEVCKQDLLGVQAEEKKVAGIVNKVKEARRDKGYSILCLISEHISADYLEDILMPFKDVLSESQDRIVIDKMGKCMSNICVGLERNRNISLTEKSVFIYGILNERIISLKKDKEEDTKEDNKAIERHDSYILEPEPKKARLIPRTSLKATAHVLVEFAVEFLSSLLKKRKYLTGNKEHHMLLDPFLKILGKCIDSEYPEICSYAMKCISLLTSFPLPSLEEEMESICKQIFLVFDKFASPELTKGKIFELVQLAFRTLALIIKSSETIKFSDEELGVVMHYLHANLHDRKQQPTVYIVLQAIIARKIDSVKLHELMKIVKEMSVTCGGFNELQQARTTFFAYFLTYPMKAEVIKKTINYYLGNVSFDRLDGRMSASLMINNIVTEFPLSFFDPQMEASIWFQLAQQLVVEEHGEHRNVLQKTLRTMFQRSQNKEKLADLSIKLLIEKPKASLESNAIAIQMASKTLIQFLDVDPQHLPESVIVSLLPKLMILLHPQRYHAQFHLKDEDIDDVEMSMEVCHMDSCLVASIELFAKLAKVALIHKDWKNHINPEVWIFVQKYLFYPHLQVRACAAGLIGHLLSAYPVYGTALPPLAKSTDEARSLVLDLCEQLRTETNVNEALLIELSMCVIRNLIYLVRNASRVPLTKTENENEDNETIEKQENSSGSRKENTVVSNALWVLDRVGKMAYLEKRFERSNTIIRVAFLNLIAGLVVMLGDKIHEDRLLNFIIAHLANERSDESTPHKLMEKNNEVVDLLKEQIGIETYTRHLTTAQTGRAKKRLGRKAHSIQQKALNPALAAKRKKFSRKKYLENKKRKLVESKGKVFKRKKLT